MFFSKLVKRKFGDRMEKWNTQVNEIGLEAERRHHPTACFLCFADDNCSDRGFVCVEAQAQKKMSRLLDKKGYG